MKKESEKQTEQKAKMLTAEEARELSNKSRAHLVQEQKKKLIEEIYGQCLDGLQSIELRKEKIYAENVDWLKSNGYKVRHEWGNGVVSWS